MSDYSAPTGPPPPQVPEGWKAVWNPQYNEYFYVNLHTKESTWDKPTMPAPRPGEDLSHGGAPPSYQAGSNAPYVSDDKKTHLESNNPYGYNAATTGGVGQGRETDEDMARRLQREEEERNRGHSPNPATMGSTGDRGHSDAYYGGGGQQPQGYYNSGMPQQQQQQQSGYLGASSGGYPAVSPGGSQKKSGGLFGKLKEKLSAPPGGSSGYGHQQPGGYGGHQSGGMGGLGGMASMLSSKQHGYPQQHGGYMMPAHKKKPGMGMGGAAALGVGGGLMGGMLLADAMDDDDYGGGDYGGGDDFGGGDFGGE